MTMLRIVEYSTILMLDYFEDIMANLGLPEDLLLWDSNYMTWIKNNYIKHESDRIRKAWVESRQELWVKLSR